MVGRTSASVVGAACWRPAPYRSSKHGERGTALPLDPRGNRSSRGIERACWEDVAFKVITSMRTPDHSTIAEFRRRHEADIAELFDDVLGLCREAGLVSVGVITIDGTKIKANASMDQNRSYSAVDVSYDSRRVTERAYSSDEGGNGLCRGPRCCVGQCSGRGRQR
jgi:hypothetical protein